MTDPSHQSKKFDVYQLVHLTQKLNYIYYFLSSSVLFWLMNLPFLISLFIFDLRLTTLPIFLLTGLSLGPTFQALLIAIHQVEIKGIWPSFFKALNQTWKKSMVVWTLTVILVGLISANLLLQSLTNYFPGFKWLLFFLLVLIGGFVVNYFLLVMAYPSINLRNSILTTLQLSIVKSGRYALSLIIILSISVIMTQAPIYLLFFGVAIMAWLLDLNYRKMIAFIEESKVE